MVNRIEIQNLPLWDRLNANGIPIAFELELTARCNNNCRHCYINLPPYDKLAQAKEMSLDQIEAIADQAVELGSLWVTLTGGEPLLRPDFFDVYLMFKKKGFLINLFTNACLISDRHIQLFKKYPPRDIEVTVYGITENTYEAVSRVPGTYRAFRRGLDLLLANGMPVTLKAVSLQSNKHELTAISEFCQDKTHRPFRFDPFLHLRYDRDAIRNEEIKQERLEPEEIVSLEMGDETRFHSMQQNCESLIKLDTMDHQKCASCTEHFGCKQYSDFSKLFRCGIGVNEFNVSYDGQLRLCSSLSAPNTTVDLRSIFLKQGLSELKTRIKEMQTQSIAILETCKSCPISNLCMWCHATAYLETGDMEGEVAYFCAVAHSRAAALHTVQA